MNTIEYLEKHLPPEKAKLVLAYLDFNNCALRITKPRKTKRGDFRISGKKLSISINHDINSYRFLFTLVHEIAHLKTHIEKGNRVKPHGLEWKNNFRSLFYSFKMEEEFAADESILTAIEKELLAPKACSGVNLELERAFMAYDDASGTYLDELAEGQVFIFRGHKYEKLETRRTRAICLNLGNKRKYTINKAAIVEVCA